MLTPKRFALCVPLLFLFIGTAKALPFGLDALPFLKSAFTAAKEVGAEHDLYFFLFHAAKDVNGIDAKVTAILDQGTMRPLGEDALNQIDPEQYALLEEKLKSKLVASHVDLALADGTTIVNWMMGKNLQEMSTEVPDLLKGYHQQIKDFADVFRLKWQEYFQGEVNTELAKIAVNHEKLNELQIDSLALVHKTTGIANDIIRSQLPFRSKSLIWKSYIGIASWQNTQFLADILPTLKLTEQSVGATNKDFEMVIGILNEPQLNQNAKKLKAKLETLKFDLSQIKAINETLDAVLAKNKIQTLLFEQYLDSWYLTVAAYKSTVVNELCEVGDFQSNLQTITGSMLDMQTELLIWARLQNLSTESQQHISQIFTSLMEMYH